MLENVWQKLTEAVLTPKIDEQTLQNKLDELKPQLPIPLFWLLGKTQSGKTSLIRALTHRDDATIGNSFQPCTKTAYIYDFPSVEHPILRFLDTRGLGEIDYNPEEDIQLFQEQAHLLIVVMRVTDHAQHSVLQAVVEILKKRPHWQLIVVQTTLHDAYPSINTEHVQPYPYQATGVSASFPPTVPHDLARSLIKQRQDFNHYLTAHLGDFAPAQFIAVDFTLPEDGYEPVDYGLGELWNAIEHALPLGLRGLLNASQLEELHDIYAKAAYPHIITYALLASAAGAVPVPFVGTPLLLSIQAKMCHTLASIYNQELNSQRLAELGSILGVSYTLRLAGRELIKFIPVYGSVVSSIYAGAVTFALGKTVSLYFKHILEGHVPDKNQFEKIYANELQHGKEILQHYLSKK